MKQILEQMQDYKSNNATSDQLYFIAGQLVVKYQTINAVKAVKADITAAFGNYKAIVSRCKELIRNGWDIKKSNVLSGFTYNNVLVKAWEIAKMDVYFAEICNIAIKDGLFVNAEDFINRYYPNITKEGQPVCRQSYTNGVYRWTEYHVRPVDKFTDTFALQATKASLKYFYDSIRNDAINKKTRINVQTIDAPINIEWLDAECTKDINLDIALSEISDSRDADQIFTIREYNKLMK